MTPATTFEDIAPSAIKPHPSNPRQHVGDVTELADSIKAQGVLEPLIVAPIADAAPNARHRWTLIAGHRRLAAAQVARIKTVPAVVRADLDTTSKQLEAMLVENLHRVDLTAIEEGDAYQALLDLGDYTQTKIAKALGRSKAIVRDRLKVAKLPESIRDRVLPGQITITDATAMAEFLDDPDALAELEEYAGTGNFTWKLHSLRYDRERAKEHAKTLKTLAAQGVTVLDEAPEEGPCVEVWDLVPHDQWPTDPGDEENDEVVFDRFLTEHASCPGHTAILLEHQTDPEYVCTRPDLHPTNDNTQDGDAAEGRTPKGPSPEELQERKDRDDLAAVAKARRAHLGRIVHAPDNQDLALELARAPWIELATKKNGSTWLTRERRALAEVLYDAPDKITDDDLPEQLAGTIRTLPLAALIVLNNISLDSEAALESPASHCWRGDWSHTKEWRAQLVEDFGYEWTDVELRMLGETTTADEPAEDEDGVA